MVPKMLGDAGPLGMGRGLRSLEIRNPSIFVITSDLVALGQTVWA